MTFEQIARNYKNAVKIKGIDVLFYVEGKDDVSFWNNVFDVLAFPKTYDIYHYTQEVKEDGSINKSTGKNTVLKYAPYTDSSFMLCIDSDYDYLLNVSNQDIHHHIFQTYSYSIENYLSYAPSLKNLCLQTTHSTTLKFFDIELFLKDYSEIIYPLLILQIISESRPDSTNQFLSKKDFSKIIRINQQIDLTNNGRNELQKLKTEVDKTINSLSHHYSQDEYQQVETRFISLGVTPQNAYLFVRGHDLYGFVVLRLLRKIVEHLRHLKLSTLSATDKKAYIDSCSKIEDLLKENQNYKNCFLLKKIENDIKYL